MKADVKIDVKQLQRNLKALPGALPDRVIQHGLKAAASVAAKQAKQPDRYFTSRTGAAAKSIRVGLASRRDRRSGGKHLFAKVKIGGPGARHGSLLELGTSTMKARAPIRQAVVETIPQAWRAAVAAMQKRFAKLESDAKRGKISKADLRAALDE